MRTLLSTFLLVFSLNAFAYNHSYGVSGEDENGKSVEGEVYSTNGDRTVSGEITDENGETHDFDGQWDGRGQISGETDDGVSVDLNTD
jgi:hypothetical protein